jgi:Bacterial capsule synthesis protein PGA_cap
VAARWVGWEGRRLTRLAAWLSVGLSATALAATDGALTVTAVGDVRISPAFANNHLDAIRRLTLRGDVVFANFEGVLAERTDPDPWRFCVPFVVPRLLRRIGLNTLTLANNHSLDLGADAYAKTAMALTQEGFLVAGRAGSSAVTEVKGRRVRVVGFSFDAPNNVNDLDAIPSIIGTKGDEIVIVSAHMGGENHLGYLVPRGVEHFGKESRGDVVRFSRRAIDAGADLVLGHGPHIPREIELYKGKLIVYSLGNFVFDYPGAAFHPHAPGYSIAITLSDRGNFVSARIDSYDLRYGIPEPDGSRQAYRMIRNLTLSNLGERSLVFPGDGMVERSSQQ